MIGINCLLVGVILVLNFMIVYSLIRKHNLFSPYTYFYFFLITLFIGPVFYYLIMNGTSYRRFDNSVIYIYSVIAIFVFFLYYVFVNSKKNVRLRRFPFFVEHGQEKAFNLYIAVTMLFLFFYLFKYRNQLLLIKIFRGDYSDLTRSDTSGAIPHWFTVSTFLSEILPSFYFYYFKKIKSTFLQFLLFFAVGLLTMIDGNKATFVYLILFLFLYVYKLKINKYMIVCAATAMSFYYVIKGGSINRISSIIVSAFRRFFVTQGACFINRFEMVRQGYDFSHTDRISKDVYTFIYHADNGSGPTIFWGDIFVKYGYIAMISAIVVTMIVLYKLSSYIEKHYYEDLFLYYSYSCVVFLLCMAELSPAHIARIMLIVFNALLYLLLTKRKVLFKGKCQVI